MIPGYFIQERYKKLFRSYLINAIILSICHLSPQRTTILCISAWIFCFLLYNTDRPRDAIKHIFSWQRCWGYHTYAVGWCLCNNFCVEGIRTCPCEVYLLFYDSQYFLLLTIPSKLTEAVLLVTGNWYVLAFSPGQGTDLSWTWGFFFILFFSQSLHTCRDDSYARLWLLPAFHIHNFLLSRLFSTV